MDNAPVLRTRTHTRTRRHVCAAHSQCVCACACHTSIAAGHPVRVRVSQSQSEPKKRENTENPQSNARAWMDGWYTTPRHARWLYSYNTHNNNGCFAVCVRMRALRGGGAGGVLKVGDPDSRETHRVPVLTIKTSFSIGVSWLKIETTVDK